MAFANLTGAAYFPRIPTSALSGPSVNSVATLDAVGEGVAIACEAPKTGNIRKIIIRTATVTVAGTATLTGRLKEIDRTATPAIPHATNLSHVNATGDYSVLTTDDVSFLVMTLTADAAVTKGDPLMVEVMLTAISSTASVQIAENRAERGSGYPYGLTNTSGAYALIGSQGIPILLLEYDDGSYEPVTDGLVGGPVTTITFNSGSTPDTWAQTFQLPVPKRLEGFWIWSDADDEFTVRICTTDYHQANATGILVSKTINKQDRAVDGLLLLIRKFASSVDLLADTDYMLVIEPGATGISIYDQGFPSLAAMDSVPGGQKFYLRSAKDPTSDASWTKYNAGTFRSLLCGLLLEGFSDGAGGAGGGPAFGPHGLGGPTFKGAA